LGEGNEESPGGGGGGVIGAPKKPIPEEVGKLWESALETQKNYGSTNSKKNLREKKLG